MHIGKVSDLTGATRKAIRHYEAISLIPVPLRRGKYRVYTDNDVALIRMIKRAQTVGFTLTELSELVSYKARHNRFPLDIASDLINNKRNELSDEMARITQQNENLNALQDELNAAFSPNFNSQDVCLDNNP